MYSVDFSSVEHIKDDWDVSFIGIHSDDRDVCVKEFLENASNDCLSAEYIPSEMSILINGVSVELHLLEDKFNKYSDKSIVIDATSMSVGELYLIGKHLYLAGARSVDVMYAEPEEYTKDGIDSFALSDSGIGFSGSGIPTLTFPQDDDKQILVFLGYEGDRLSDALEVLQAKPDQVTLIFGVPSYKLNWEKNSYNGNLRVIIENQLLERFQFAGANNSKATMNKLQEVYYECVRNDQQLVIVPIGTKPQAISALPFVAKNNDGSVSVLWDQPIRKVGRTKGISTISLTKDVFTDV